MTDFSPKSILEVNFYLQLSKGLLPLGFSFCMNKISESFHCSQVQLSIVECSAQANQLFNNNKKKDGWCHWRQNIFMKHAKFLPTSCQKPLFSIPLLSKKKKKKNIEQDIIWSTLFKDTECTLIHTNKHQFTTNESLQWQKWPRKNRVITVVSSDNEQLILRKAGLEVLIFGLCYVLTLLHNASMHCIMGYTQRITNIGVEPTEPLCLLQKITSLEKQHWQDPPWFEFLVIFDFFAPWYRRRRETSSVKIS